MKGKITITVSEKHMRWLEIEAKERNMTVIQFAEELFEKMVDELREKEKLRKVS